MILIRMVQKGNIEYFLSGSKILYFCQYQIISFSFYENEAEPDSMKEQKFLIRHTHIYIYSSTAEKYQNI